MPGAWHNTHVALAMATKRKAYTVTTKLQAVEVAEKTSKEAAARQFGVDPRRIREWCAQKDAVNWDVLLQHLLSGRIGWHTALPCARVGALIDLSRR